MSSGQKFIARNRAPRVQIEYDVELYGAEKKVQLPFVMGVVSDLAGKSEVPQPAIADRKFLEIDVDNFDDRMKAMAPRAAFTVPNTLTDEGNLAVDLTFTSMDDFSPAAIARNVDVLKPLLEARAHLSNLMTYMDGKAGAEALIEDILSQPELLKSLSGAVTAATATATTLDALRSTAPADAPHVDEAADVLAAMARTEVAAEVDTSTDILAGIKRVEDIPEVDTTADVLAGIEHVEGTQDVDTTADVLAGIEQVEDTLESDTTADVLAGIEQVEDTQESDTTADVLAGIEQIEETQEDDTTADVLAGIEQVETPENNSETAEDILAGLEAVVDEPEDETALNEILNNIETVPEAEVQDDTDDVLAELEAAAPEPDAAKDDLDNILADIEPVQDDDEGDDDISDVLSGLEAAPEAEQAEDLDDILSGLDTHQPETEATDDMADVLAGIETPPEDAKTDDRDDVLAGLDTPVVEDSKEDHDDILSGLDTSVPAEEHGDDLEDVLAGLEGTAPAPDAGDDLNDVLAGIDTTASKEEAADDITDVLAALEPAQEAEETDEMADILSELDTPEDTSGDAGEDDLDDILAGLDIDDAEPTGESDDVDALLADLEAPQAEDASADDLDDILAGLDTDDVQEASKGDDLDALLADLGSQVDDAEDGDDLDDILANLDADDTDDGDGDDIDALLADLDTDDNDADENVDLDAKLDDLGGESDESDDAGETDMTDSDPTPPPPVQSPFGTISATRPERTDLNRSKFRMALLGDFTGRAARGVLETGDALAARKPILLDVDTIDDVIEGFGTTLVLPIGEGGTGVEIKLGEMDDLHPDELYENVALFEAIAGVRQQLNVGSMAERAVDQLKSWSETYATPIKLPKRSAGAAMPAHLKLSDFQALIGDTRGALTQAGPADALIAQIIGPHVVKAPDAGTEAMTAAVDEALSSAMNLILHHPEFQAIESQWRSLDLLARRIETDTTLEIVLYDVSAEELAADLAASEDLAESGFYKLVTDVLDPEQGAGGFSALFGLYTFEETPPHAELLARIATVAAHVDAPFFSAISPNYLDTPVEDRHPMVAENWDTLRALPESAYVALASPRFLLRQPYGAKSDPIYTFKFEEFSQREGLKSMLWANPAVLVAILLAGTYKKDGKAMDLGTLMSLGDLPFFYVNDRHGDQVALPCTERNLTTDPAQATLQRGYMPVVWMKGRNEIRLGSFRSLGGDTIAGPWQDSVPELRKAPSAATLEVQIGAPGSGAQKNDADTSLDDLMSDAEDSASQEDDDGSLDDLLAGLDGDDSDDGDTSLDDLLASFDDDDGDAPVDDEEMDAELAALLEGL